jgi:hypothetical protein
VPVPSLDSQIDDLYRAPLGGFVSARTALAKTLTGADAQRVKRLPKPTLVPWAVNQVYWRARAVFDRLTKTGERLREGQVAALEGKKVDLKALTDAHRRALSEAVQQATTIAEAEGSHPAADGLMRTFEAISLARDRQDAPGRWTEALQPAGFEALTGVKVATPVKSEVSSLKSAAEGKKAAAARKKAEAEQKKREAEIKKAEAALERARRRMAEAQAALKDVRDR